MPWLRFINAFGQPKTTSTITMLGHKDHMLEGMEEEIEKKLKRLIASLGRPLPDVNVKVFDEQGNTLPLTRWMRSCANGLEDDNE